MSCALHKVVVWSMKRENNKLDFSAPIIARTHKQSPRPTVLEFTGKKLALWFIAHEFVVGDHPPTFTSRLHHVISVPRPSLIFTDPPLLCMNANQRTKKKKKNGRGLRNRL